MTQQMKQKRQASDDPRSKKPWNYCSRCGTELVFKEKQTGHKCFYCARNDADKEIVIHSKLRYD